MSQPTLSHLTALLASPPPIKHTWNVGDDMAAMGNESPVLLKQVGSSSFRALLGLQAALNEWVAARFHDQSQDGDLALLTDATWAASIDYRYVNLDAMEFPDATGLIQGPIRECKVQTRDVLQQFRVAEFGAVGYVIASANLVRYVLPTTKPFQDWFKAVVTRLQPLSLPSARQSGALDIADVKRALIDVSPDVFGTPLPREAYDLSVDLSTVNAAALIDAMLQRIAATPNPYLRSPAELQQAGFVGTPYRYPA